MNTTTTNNDCREVSAEELQTVDGGFWGTILGLLRIGAGGGLDGKSKDLESEDRLGNFEIQG